MTSDTLSADVPVDDDVLDLEAKHSSNVPVRNSRRMLVRKKRAFELARLLDARRVLAAQREALVDRTTVLDTLDREDVRTAVNAALSAIKSRRIGTNLLEITTCGAVSPYNRMLGGKLVALLLLSPRVAADYRRRYGREATIIRSQLKNARVVPDNRLVWLGTTSLFSHNSSQYERLRLPAGVIAPDQPEIRYTYLGDTSGYGTVQFADDTVRALDGLLQRRRGFRNVNGVFGERGEPPPPQAAGRARRHRLRRGSGHAPSSGQAHLRRAPVRRRRRLPVRSRHEGPRLRRRAGIVRRRDRTDRRVLAPAVAVEPSCARRQLGRAGRNPPLAAELVHAPARPAVAGRGKRRRGGRRRRSRRRRPAGSSGADWPRPDPRPSRKG